MQFQELLQSRGIPIRRSSGGNYLMCCLYCHERGETSDTRFRLCVHPGKNMAICYNCGWSSKQDTIDKILRKLHMEVVAVDGEAEPIQEEVFHMPEDFQPLVRACSDIDHIALDYLRKRRITESQIKRHRIGISCFGRYAYRIIFPVFWEHKAVGVVARDFTGTREPKYLNSQGIKALYKEPKQESVCVLSEGVFKCLRIEQVIPVEMTSSALLGKDITPVQIEQLNQRGITEVILWPDPDRPGREGVVQVAEKLMALGTIIVQVIWPLSKPADEMGREELVQAWATRKPYNWLTEQRIRIGCR